MSGGIAGSAGYGEETELHREIREKCDAALREREKEIQELKAENRNMRRNKNRRVRRKANRGQVNERRRLQRKRKKLAGHRAKEPRHFLP